MSDYNKCASCGTYQSIGYQLCKKCGVNNRLYRVYSLDVLVDIANKLDTIIKKKEILK